jgi:hypothetical protein
MNLILKQHQADAEAFQRDITYWKLQASLLKSRFQEVEPEFFRFQFAWNGFLKCVKKMPN